MGGMGYFIGRSREKVRARSISPSHPSLLTTNKPQKRSKSHPNANLLTFLPGNKAEKGTQRLRKPIITPSAPFSLFSKIWRTATRVSVVVLVRFFHVIMSRTYLKDYL